MHGGQVLLGVVLLAGVVALVAKPRVDYQTSDPLGTLVLSQTIVGSGTIRLDDLPATARAGLGYRLHRERGHTYYAFPVGTSLVVAPAVWVANRFGFDMRRGASEMALQRILVVVAEVLVVALMLALASRWLPWPSATLCTAVFWAGTSLSSTVGSAWLHRPASACS